MDRPLSTQSLPWKHRPFAELIKLAWPIAVQLLSFSTMTAVDTLFIGHLGPSALAGVALGSVATFTLVCFGFGMLRATNITIAQAVGAGKQQQVLAFTGASLTMAAGVGLIIAIVGQLVASLLPLISSSLDSGQHASAYARVRVLGAPLQLLVVALEGACYGVRDSRTPMLATLTANAANVVLVAFFSLVLGAGVAGVACATVLASFAEIYLLARNQRKKGFGLRAWTIADLRVLSRIGLPLGVERFFDVGSFGVLIALMALMGDMELAAHQVAHQAMLFSFLPVMAIGDAATVLMGQAVGASSLRTVPRVQRAALTAGLLYVALCSATYIVFGAQIAGVFTEEHAVIERAAQLLSVGALLVWTLPFYSTGQCTLRSIGDVRAASLITVIAAWGCTAFFGSVFGLVLGMGARGGYLGIVAELSLAALAFWWRIRGRGGAWVTNVRRYRSELRRAGREQAVPGGVIPVEA